VGEVFPRIKDDLEFHLHTMGELGEVLRVAASSIRTALNYDVAAIQLDGDRILPTTDDTVRKSQHLYASFRESDPSRSEARLAHLLEPTAATANGIKRYALVPIKSADGAKIGRLIACAFSGGDVTQPEIDLMRSVASSLGSACDRIGLSGSPDPVGNLC
jgi:GAF domain-containing protein